MTRSKIVLVVAICVLCMGSMYAEEPDIIVYGQNAPEWNKNLGVTATRGSCSSEAEVCIKNVGLLLAGQHTKHFYLNLPTDPVKSLSYASFYSKASKTEPRLYEVDLDDFSDHFTVWCRTNPHCDRVLNEIIDNVKSANAKLKSGLTIYEDDIPILQANPHLTPEIRNKVDTIHLYIHERANGPKFERYLKQIKEMFPNAKAIAGVYAYDRLDFEKCHGCSAAEARDLQKQTLREQVRLLQSGALVGLEFYPGHFGWEEKWEGWNDPAECAPGRKEQCAENTKAMHNDAVMILRGLKK